LRRSAGADTGEGVAMSTASGRSTRRIGRRFAAVATSVVLATTAVVTSAAAAPTRSSPAGGRTFYAINKPVCARPTTPHTMQCYAIQRVTVAKGTPGAYKYTVPNLRRLSSSTTPNLTPGLGQAGGYTPDDLAIAYGFDPTVSRTSQTIGIIDWFDDPKALSDLNKFDTMYGLPHETSTSFRKLNQKGHASPLPVTDHAGSVEIALDIQSARGVCHTCRILLIEADGPSDKDLATAENLAVKLGADEISNSFGEPEVKVPSSVFAAYNHPGVVITASTGDDGWFGWDFANNSNPPNVSQNAASFPSTSPDVVAVGGTELFLNNDATRFEEDVWNENGFEDFTGFNNGQKMGATGGGCSRLYAAKSWQSHQPGYAAASCHGKRLAADVSAIADPQTGFDIIDNFAPGAIIGIDKWITIGGTSLASPVLAAMYALAGGSGGAAYPSSSLYVNSTHLASSLYDVVPGTDANRTADGNSFCGGTSPSQCGLDVFNSFTPHNHNPNALGGGNIDCSFPHNHTDPPNPPPLSSECNAVPGYDGPSGLGVPAAGNFFNHTNPKVTLTKPSLMKLRVSETFKAKATEPISSIHVTSFAWNWGDGHGTKTSSTTTHHTYTKAGTFTVTLTVGDTSHQLVIKKTSVTVGKHAVVHYSGPSSLHVGHSGSFSTRGSTDPNTGGKITKVTFHWGDGHTTTATSAHHSYSHTGKFTITIVVKDNTGVTTTVTKHVKVT
jgi:hypothetical protein